MQVLDAMVLFQATTTGVTTLTVSTSGICMYVLIRVPAKQLTKTTVAILLAVS
jgi:hypothetical protein